MCIRETNGINIRKVAHLTLLKRCWDLAYIMETNGVIKIHKVALIGYTQKELKPRYNKTNEINISKVAREVCWCILALRRCWHLSLADSRGGARDAPPGSKFFHFHALFGKNLKNNSNFGSWRPPPLGKILDPPLPVVLVRNVVALKLYPGGALYELVKPSRY